MTNSQQFDENMSKIAAVLARIDKLYDDPKRKALLELLQEQIDEENRRNPSNREIHPELKELYEIQSRIEQLSRPETLQPQDLS